MRVLRGDGPTVLPMERRILLIQGSGDQTEQRKQDSEFPSEMRRTVPPLL